MHSSAWVTPQKRGKFVSIFLIFFFLSILILVLFQTSVGSTVGGSIGSFFRPVQRFTYTLFSKTQANDSSTELGQLRQENQQLRVALAKQEDMKREIEALHDQFETTTPNPTHLIPAQIVGIKSFVPGFSIPSEIIIDAGSRDGITVGQVVVSKNILVGRVTTVSKNASKVELTTNESFSITAKASKTNALGVIHGKGSGMMLLDNVLLSDKLEKNDQVVTKGSINEQGIGTPPGLILGKIISINKKASELFQTAEVAPLLNISQVSTVFILDPS